MTMLVTVCMLLMAGERAAGGKHEWLHREFWSRASATMLVERLSGAGKRINTYQPLAKHHD
jgi:hypothetical protein